MVTYEQCYGRACRDGRRLIRCASVSYDWLVFVCRVVLRFWCHMYLSMKPRTDGILSANTSRSGWVRNGCEKMLGVEKDETRGSVPAGSESAEQ